MIHKKGLWIGLTYIFVFLLCLSILASSILETYRSTVDMAFGTQSETLVSDDDGSLYSAFKPADKYLNTDGTGNSKALLKGEIELGRKQAYEGSVLLKNNGALPLAKGSAVTLLGKRSHTPLLGSGMGVDVAGQIITLETALSGSKTNFAAEKVNGDYSSLDNFSFSELNIEGRTDGAGAGFKLNMAMIARYTSLLATSAYACSYNDSVYTTYNPKEPGRSNIENVKINSYKDAAIIVFGRPNSEATDYLPNGVSGGTGAEQPLELTTAEREIVSYATEKFDKVIVLLNTNSPMEIKELKDNDKVDAILWVGHMGSFGSLGVADILCGRVNPSGGLYDIYAAKNMSAPAMMNMGGYIFTNSNLVTRGSTGVGNTTHSDKYIIEAEGIYVGYRYYETRYNDVVIGKGNADSTAGVYASKGNWRYQEEVAYGFGYGLSYTDFKFELVGTPKTEIRSHEMYMTFTVKVSNTGTAAGKTSVQIYGQAPYVHGVTKVEKSAIQLLNFTKTGIIEAGASETVTVEVDLQNIASYDNTYQNADGTVGSYILDEGNYYFAVGNGSHDALNNVLAKQGYTPSNTADKMDAEGKDELVYVWNYEHAGKADATTFGISKNNTQVSNQIPYADWNYFDGAPKVTYLSRNDWAGTYPKEYVSLAIPASMLSYFNGNYYEVSTTDDTSDIVWGQSGDLKFYQLAMSDFDDPRWKQLLNQLTMDESIVLAAIGGNVFPGAESIGLVSSICTENSGNGIASYTPVKAIDKNMPWYLSESDKNSNMSLKCFGSAPLVASSFNPDLMYELGEFIATEALFVGLPILWGPGLNTHRHAYNGRNGEYYSEDPVLCGVAAMEFAVGARDNGLIATMKHFAFNDQETYRCGVAPFMTEQRAREVELRAFQIAIEATKYDKERGEDTGLIGMMTSFSKIGPVECTSSRGLLNGIAIGEWGFHGQLVSDIYDDVDLYASTVWAGCTGYDYRGVSDFSVSGLADKKITWHGTAISADMFAKDAEMQAALKQSNHNSIWSLCQSNLMNRYNSSTHSVWLMTWWRGAYIAAIAVTGTLTLCSAVLTVISYIKGRKERES